MDQNILREEGVFSDRDIKNLIINQGINLEQPLAPGQLQPASLDLRLGKKAYRVSASFIPGRQASVEEKLAELALYELDLRQDSVLETDCVYVIELLEALNLPDDIYGRTNPKSSTGRLNIFTRIFYDYAHKFDKIHKGYKGKLYIEVCPRSFPIKVRTGSSLAQIRFCKGQTILKEEALIFLQKKERLLDSDQTLITNNKLSLSIDLSGQEQALIGYRAKRHTSYIDIDKAQSAEIDLFWEPIYKKGPKGIILDPYEFYIFSSQETVFIPEDFAAEMEPFVAEMGEFRVHYAGFFDPGFGQRDDKGVGSKAVLEVRSRDMPFIVEHGQPIGYLIFEYMRSRPERVYGKKIGSNYQKQGLKLSKHFRMLTL